MIAGEEENQSVTERVERSEHRSQKSSTNGYQSSATPAGRNANSERSERFKTGALEVSVDNNIEKAMKILKRKLIKEGLFKELKSRRYYEKPSERRKRKHKESLKKVRKDEARQKKNQSLF